jgi:acetylornithine deacetylase/succinyl-diaminopimelate desuccinylase-like protein
LCRTIAALKSPDEAITVPAFYARVRRPPTAERRLLADGRAPAAALARAAGTTLRGLQGERGWSPGERSTLRPAVTVTELHAGGPAAGAAVATSSTARLNFRLVPDQRADEVVTAVAEWFASRVPVGITLRFDVLGATDPVLVPTRHPVVSGLKRALSATWGMPPAEVRSGGTVPIVSALQDRYGMPAAMWGLSAPEDNVHGPNESFALRDLELGARVVERLLTGLACS